MVNWILLAICAGLIVWVVRLFAQLENAREEITKRGEDYAALEKGMNEQQENFEQEYLSFDEATKKARELKDENLALKETNQELVQANASLDENLMNLQREFNIRQEVAAERLRIIRRQQAEIEAMRRAGGG